MRNLLFAAGNGSAGVIMFRIMFRRQSVQDYTDDCGLHERGIYYGYYG